MTRRSNPGRLPEQQSPSSFSSIPIQDSQEPSAEGKQVVTLFNEMKHKQLDFLDEAGKSIIERISTFLAVLFGVTVLNNTFPPKYLVGNPVAKVLVIVTLALYLGALFAGMWTIQPRSYRHYLYNMSQLSKELEKMISHKALWLRVAGIFFALGTVALALVC